MLSDFQKTNLIIQSEQAAQGVNAYLSAVEKLVQEQVVLLCKKHLLKFRSVRGVCDFVYECDNIRGDSHESFCLLFLFLLPSTSDTIEDINKHLYKANCIEVYGRPILEEYDYISREDRQKLYDAFVDVVKFMQEIEEVGDAFAAECRWSFEHPTAYGFISGCADYPPEENEEVSNAG